MMACCVLTLRPPIENRPVACGVSPVSGSGDSACVFVFAPVFPRNDGGLFTGGFVGGRVGGKLNVGAGGVVGVTADELESRLTPPPPPPPPPPPEIAGVHVVRHVPEQQALLAHPAL